MTGDAITNQGRPLRVNFIGNTCNNHYVLAKGLRRLGVEAKLYFEEEGGFQEDPASEDAELAGALLPDWIVPIARQYSRWTFRTRLSGELLKRVADCDLLHAHGVGVVWAGRAGRPFIWHPYGTDITSWLHYNSKVLISAERLWALPLPRPHYLALPLQMRRALNRVSAILLGWHNNLWRDGYQHIRRWGLEDRVVRFHLAIDTEKFRPLDRKSRDALRAQLLAGEGALTGPLLFHPTRQAFTRPGDLYGYKANDRLYRALGAFARQNGEFTLVIVEKGVPDELAARAIIAQSGIGSRVRWVKAMPRHQLAAWYQAADVTVESFFTGAIGSAPLESMACGTPVMMHLQLEGQVEDRGFFLDPHRLFAELPPIIRCRTESEILDRLVQVVANPQAIETLRKDCREWIERHASTETTSARLIDLYRSILEGS